MKATAFEVCGILGLAFELAKENIMLAVAEGPEGVGIAAKNEQGRVVEIGYGTTLEEAVQSALRRIGLDPDQQTVDTRTVRPGEVSMGGEEIPLSEYKGRWMMGSNSNPYRQPGPVDVHVKGLLVVDKDGKQVASFDAIFPNVPREWVWVVQNAPQRVRYCL